MSGSERAAASLGLRRAGPSDVGPIEALLNASSLPSGRIEEFIDNFLVAEEDGRLTATGAFEPYGDCAVLRSVAVASDLRGRGMGRELALAVMDAARQAGARSFYLFTIDSPGFWEKLGFQDLPLPDWPPAAQGCWQYSYVVRHLERFQAMGIRSMWRLAG